MGWRTTTTFLPISRRRSDTRRLVWLLPDPVRTAHTEITGTLDSSMVSFQPIRRKSAPAARTIEARCIT